MAQVRGQVRLSVRERECGPQVFCAPRASATVWSQRSVCHAHARRCHSHCRQRCRWCWLQHAPQRQWRGPALGPQHREQPRSRSDLRFAAKDAVRQARRLDRMRVATRPAGYFENLWNTRRPHQKSHHITSTHKTHHRTSRHIPAVRYGMVWYGRERTVVRRQHKTKRADLQSMPSVRRRAVSVSFRCALQGLGLGRGRRTGDDCACAAAPEDADDAGAPEADPDEDADAICFH